MGLSADLKILCQKQELPKHVNEHRTFAAVLVESLSPFKKTFTFFSAFVSRKNIIECVLFQDTAVASHISGGQAPESTGDTDVCLASDCK